MIFVNNVFQKQVSCLDVMIVTMICVSIVSKTVLSTDVLRSKKRLMAEPWLAA